IIQSAVQNPRVQNVGNLNGLIGVQGNGNQNQIRNGNLIAARAEGNAAGQNGNQIRCYNYRGVEEYDLMAATADLDEIQEVNANCILMANLQQASTSGTQTDSAPVYDTDRSAEVHENYDDNEIFNMFTQEEQYTKLLEPIPESHQVPQNDNNVISKDTSVEQGGETVEEHPTNFEETHALYELLYQNLEIEVEKVNSVNRKLKETNADLTTELARYKNQERRDTATCSRESCKMKQMKKEIKPANYTKINHLSGDHSDDTTPSVARKFLNEVKSTIVTLQHVVKQQMTIKTHNWSSSAHQELHKIIRDENFPIVNQVDARLQNFKIQFLKEAAKFVGDFKSLANEADASLAKHKALELEIKRLLKAVIKRLQAQLEDLKGKCKDTSCVSDTQNQLFQKLENANVELEFQVFNYARENAPLKATYKNLFDSIFVSRVQTETKIASLQNELQSNIYKNAKLRTQLFKKVSDQKDNTQDSSKNTKFEKQPNVEILSKIGVNNAKVIAPGMFRISPDKFSREAKKVPNTVSASSRTKPITVSQPSVITKKDMNSNLNGLSFTGLDNTKTRRP
nr:hypothetical protein [Tanacetum cinerariifolium]